jgi:arylsulfatase
MNILILCSDQHRWDAMGCVTEDTWLPDVETPNLDKLAASGTRFNNAVCNYPVCMASRHSFISGMYGYQTGANLSNHNYFPDQMPVPTLGHHLQAQGYKTAAIGKMHWKPFQSARHNLPDTRGFEVRIAHEPTREDPAQKFYIDDVDPDAWEKMRAEQRAAPGESAAGYVGLVSEVPAAQHYDSWVCDHAIEFLDHHDGSQPFGMIVSMHNPHAPGIVPPEFDELYRYDQMPMPPQPPEGFEEEDPYAAASGRWPDYDSMTDDDTRMAISRYLALVTMVDWNVGRVLDALERNGLTDDTLVVYMSDHGELLGERRYWTKYCSYENALRVPFIVRWPGQPAQVSDAPVELVDLLPTCIDAAGAEVPEYLAGRSLRPILEGQRPDDWREATFSEFGAGTDWSIRMDGYKLIERLGGPSAFYDLNADPYEYDNRIDDPAMVEPLARLRYAMLQNARRAAARYPHAWVRDHSTQDPNIKKEF